MEMEQKPFLEQLITIEREKYSPFSLFVLVVFYKVAITTELANSVPVLLGKYRVRFL
jgi:hypothetical protein